MSSLPLEINTSIIYYLKEFLVLSETQVLWDQNRIHQLPPPSLFFFSPINHQNHLSQDCKWKSICYAGSFSLHFRHWIEHQAQCILPEVSPRTHCTPFSFMLTWPPASRFSQVHLSVNYLSHMQKGRMCLHSCWSLASSSLLMHLIYSSMKPEPVLFQGKHLKFMLC